MHKLLSPAMGRLASCLLALLTYGAICVGEGSHAGEGSPPQSHTSQQQQPPQQQQHHYHPGGLLATPVGGALLDRITGGANTNNNRRRSRHSSRAAVGHPPGGGGGASEAPTPDAVEISGAELPVDSAGGGGRPTAQQQQRLDGIYVREWDVNGAPHFKRRSKVRERTGMRSIGCSRARVCVCIRVSNWFSSISFPNPSPKGIASNACSRVTWQLQAGIRLKRSAGSRPRNGK